MFKWRIQCISIWAYTMLFRFILSISYFDIICGCIAFCLCAHRRDLDVFIIWHAITLIRVPRRGSTMRKQMSQTYIRRRAQWAGPMCHFDHDALKGQNWVIEITDIKGILTKLIVRSGKKFRAFREAILRIASESRTIDEISAVFRKPSRVAISLKLCTQYEQYIVVEF